MRSEIYGGTETGLSNPADIAFPKVSGCTIKAYGVSGEMEEASGMCVLSLNILNEKIFAVLWVWFVILAILSSLDIVYRIACASVATVKV